MTAFILAPERPSRARRLLLVALLALVAAGPAPSRAELAILADGAFLHVRGYEVEGDRMRLDLATGGALRVPMLRVERIVADEVVPVPPAPPQPVVTETFPLRFDPAHQSPETPYGELIFAAAERHGLNPALVAAVARAESAFKPHAVSPKGARGLMQLMPATAARFGVRRTSITDPAKNLDAGARYLRWLADRFDDELPLVLAAYNAGEGTVARYDGVPPYRETRGYVERIYRTLGLDDPWTAPSPRPEPVPAVAVAAITAGR